MHGSKAEGSLGFHWGKLVGDFPLSYMELNENTVCPEPDSELHNVLPRCPRYRGNRRRHNRPVCARVGVPPQAMSSKRLDKLGDFRRHGYRVRIDCTGCRRFVVVEPFVLLQLCQAKHWSTQIAFVEKRLRCVQCKQRGARLGPAFGTGDLIVLDRGLNN